MTIRMNFEHEQDILTVTLQGSYSLTSLADNIREIWKRVRTTESKRVLINLTEVTGNIPNWDRYQLGTLMAAESSAPVRLAAVYRTEDINYFAETVAVHVRYRWAAVAVGLIATCPLERSIDTV